ncbi:unnamed protein product, partial [Rotaria sp. Silwood1]
EAIANSLRAGAPPMLKDLIDEGDNRSVEAG